MTTENLRAVLVGCGAMGRNQAKILSEIEGFTLVAVIDVFEPNLKQTMEAYDCHGYDTLTEALAKEAPDVVAITTANDTHAPLTIEAAQAGVRGVYCEKPMATNLGDARAMVQACEEAGTVLVINHQRRIGADLVKARELIDQGVLGRIELIRGNCAGDILSDGTHLVDSILWLAGDRNVDWVVGQVEREINDEMRKRAADQSARTGRPVEPGFRYGHPVENGGLGVFGFKPDSEDGRFIKAEITCGDLRDRYRAYQDYEIFGDKGRLWRAGDRAEPNLFLQNGQAGSWAAGLADDWTYRPLPPEGSGDGPWRPVAYPKDTENAIAEGYRRFARAVLQGEDHPMCGRNALRGFEVIMAIYESARVHKKLRLPLEQERFPLAVMIENGEIG